MKTIRNIILCALAALATVSCNEVLDMPSDGRMTLKEIFSDFDLARGYLNRCYSYMPGGGTVADYYMAYDGTLLASFSDEAQDVRDGQTGAVQNWYRGNATAAAFPMANFWGLYYEGIRTCNIFLKEIETAPFLAEDPVYEGEAQEWKAHAHALRAFYFWQIIKRYGPAPILLEPADDGYEYTSARRASFGECVDAVIADCKTAITLGLPWKIGGEKDNDAGRLSRAVVYAIQSQAALYAASDLWADDSEDRRTQWRRAAEICGTALNECLKNGYALFTETPSGDALNNSASAYQTYFFTKLDLSRNRDRETIYESRIQLAVWRDAGLPVSTGTIRAGACPSQELVDAYEMADGEAAFLLDADGCVVYDGVNPRVNPAGGYDPADPYAGRDPRLGATVYHNGSLLYLTDPSTSLEIFTGGGCEVSATDQRHTRTGYYLRKFHHNLSGSSNPADGYMKIFRLAELYLNFAEAANEGYGPDVSVPNLDGDIRIARIAVNRVRQRAGMPEFPTGMSASDFRVKYRNERRVELAFEQHRFYDVRRWNILDRTDGRVTGMRIERDEIDDGEGNVTYTYAYERFTVGERLSDESKFLRFPIPPGDVSRMEAYTGDNWQNPGW